MRNTPKFAAPAALVALLFGLSACTVPAPTAMPSASSTMPTGPATPSTSPTAPVGDALGPFGYGALKLGATKAEAKASGLAEGITGTEGECGGASDGRLLGAQPPSEEAINGQLFFSVNTGKLIAIYATGDVATPEGIKLGSTVAQLKAAFGEWGAEEGEEGRGGAPVAGNEKAYYRIVVDGGEVVELSLDSIDQDCYE